MINVTKPFLPSREDYDRYLDGIWSRVWLTNDGPLVRELEDSLKKHLSVDHLIYLSNGTMALHIAIKALELKGEIITTPFSFAATSSSIIWENCIPVYADIDGETFNIDPKEIEKKITSKTKAILATHVYGNPCDVNAIAEIAKKHKLKIIYDAAHAFGVKYKGESVFSYGDLSTASFHSTKLFHTIEGGAIITKNPEISRKVSLMRNFGFVNYDQIEGVGTNAKNSEFHAAMGLCVLKKVDEIIESRKIITEKYDSLLSELPLKKQKLHSDIIYNFAYYPVVFETEEILLKVKDALEKNEVFPRRYFYPSLEMIYLKTKSMKNSFSIASRVLCLPLYHDLELKQVESIVDIIRTTIKNR